MRECYKDYGRFKGQAQKLKGYLWSRKEDVNKKFISCMKDEKNILDSNLELNDFSIFEEFNK
jgi:hypothetical protein